MGVPAGGGVGVDAGPGAGQLLGEGGHRGAETVQGPAERIGERGHPDRVPVVPAGTVMVTPSGPSHKKQFSACASAVGIRTRNRSAARG